MPKDKDYRFFDSDEFKSSSPLLLSSSPLTGQENDGQSLDLNWLFSVLGRRLWIMILMAGVLSGGIGVLIILQGRKVQDSYGGSFQMLVEPSTIEGRLARLSLLAQTGNNASATELSKVGIQQSDLVDYETQIRVLKSPAIMQPLAEIIKNKYPDISYGYLLGNLEIKRITYEKDGKQEGTKILEVTYKDPDKDKILYILKIVSDAYVQYSLKERTETLNKGLVQLEPQLIKLQKRVDEAQVKMQRLREKYNFNYPEDTAKNLSEREQLLNSEHINIEAELTEAKSTYTNLQKQIDAENPLPTLLQDQTLQQAHNTIIAQLQAVEAQLAIQSTQFKEDSPPLQVLREKQQNLRQLLKKESQKALANLAIKIQDLEKRLRYIITQEEEVKQYLAEFPRVIREYSDLDRQVEVTSESLKSFLEKREAIRLDAAQKDPSWELISNPNLWQGPDGNPIIFPATDTKKQLMIAVILCTLLGIGTGFIIEILDNVYHSPDDIKSGTRLRLLGVIPRNKQIQTYHKKQQKLLRKGHLLTNLKPEHPANYLESFRSLYTNISLLGSKQIPIRSLVVSSATPNDGKSTVALELAATAAAIGQRVLLVDADLRQPELHNRLGLKNDRGLSEVVKKDLSLNEVTQQAPFEENLFFLGSGQMTEEPIKLLSSSKMHHLMEQLQGFFDVVIYNTPPLVGLADGLLLAANTDGMILVVRTAKTDKTLLAKTLENIKISGASVLGVVANGVKNNVVANNKIYRNSYNKSSSFEIK